VRVNDRGPYHAGRVMDVSSRVADVLDMKGMGTAKVKVDYVGPAPMEGSDDSQLLASLRTDGSPANMIGYSSPVMVANAAAEQTDTIWSFFSGGGRGGQQPQPQPEAQPAPAPAPEPPPVQVASAPEPPPPPPEPVRVAATPAETGDEHPTPPEPIRSIRQPSSAVPLPPPRPFDLSSNRSVVVAAVAKSSTVSSARLIVPPHRPEIHASAERALYYSGSVRLPPKKPTTGAFDHLKSAKSARADY
jgi:rare lipoprotein A